MRRMMMVKTKMRKVMRAMKDGDDNEEEMVTVVVR